MAKGLNGVSEGATEGVTGAVAAAGTFWPACQSCKGENARLVALSDYGPQGGSVVVKAWVCSDPTCGFMLKIDKGAVAAGRYAWNGGHGGAR